MEVQIEPKKFGHFLKACFGAVSSGRYFPTSSVSGTFTVGETVTGSTSSATAVVTAVSGEKDYLIMGAPTGTFTVGGETITGGSSGATAALGVNASTVYGHEFKGPQNSLPTYTVEIGYQNEAYRFTGVRFPSFNSVKHGDNIIMAEIEVLARAQFLHARVTAAVGAGAGSKTILLDQTQGLVSGDTIKVFRPSTQAFLDFSASNVKTHTINSISSETSINVTNLQTALAAEDIIIISPQTPSYSLGNEFSWIGGSVARTGDTITAAIAASASVASLEEFDLSITSEIDSRHAANAANTAGRFPTANLLKGFMGEIKFKRYYPDMSFLYRLRTASQTGLQIRHTGDQIGATGVYYTLDWRVPNFRYQPYHPGLAKDETLDESITAFFYKDATAGFSAKALLVTDTTSF